MNNNWYNKHTPFLIEVEFNSLIDDTKSKLIDIIQNNKEILPGLKVNKLFGQIVNLDTLDSYKLNKDIESIYNKKLNEFKNKYNTKKINSSSKIDQENFKERHNAFEGKLIEMNDADDESFPIMKF